MPGNSGFYNISDQVDGKIDQVEARGGTITWTTDGIVASVFYIDPHIPVTATLNGGTNSNVWVQMLGGDVTLNGSGTSWRVMMRDGVVTLNSAASSLYMLGGTFYYDALNVTLQTAYLLHGIFDATRTIGPKTVTTLKRMPNVEFLVNSDFSTGVVDQIIGE
jgi:hypothetical protein